MDTMYIAVGRRRVSFDAADLKLVLAHDWWLNEKGYAECRDGLMHRLIMGLPAGLVVDHKSHEPLDNRRSNLRVVTPQQNAQNRKGAQKNSSTGRRGVLFDRRTGRYRACATLHGKRHYRGYHPTAEDAARVAADLRRDLGFQGAE